MAKSLSTFLVPPNLAIAAGATTPDPGGTAARGVTVWSTTENALIRWSGSSWALVASGGGGGGGGATVTQREVDFGSPGAAEKFFSVTITGATVGQRVIATPSLDMPSGVDEDELEMDPIVCAARVSDSDTVRLLVAAPGGGRISGKRNINITIGA